MMGCSTANEDVLDIGASGNFPPPEFRTRQYFQQKAIQRRKYLGEAVYMIDSKIQEDIVQDASDPLVRLTPEEIRIRDLWRQVNWIVFRCSKIEND
jgi:hypothetical protein